MRPAPSCESDGCSAVPLAMVTAGANVPGAVNLRYCVTPTRFMSFVKSTPRPDGPPPTAGYSALHSSDPSGDHVPEVLSCASVVAAVRPTHEKTRPSVDGHGP